MEITELILELRIIYDTAPDRFSYLQLPCTVPTATPYAAGATWPATRRTLLAPHLPQHELPQAASPWHHPSSPRAPTFPVLATTPWPATAACQAELPQPRPSEAVVPQFTRAQFALPVLPAYKGQRPSSRARPDYCW